MSVGIAEIIKELIMLVICYTTLGIILLVERKKKKNDNNRDIRR